MKHLSKEDDMLLVHTSLGQLLSLISELLQEHISSSDLPETIFIDEVCRITGYKKSTIYKLISQHKISCYEPEHGGRRKFFKRSEVNAWMQKTRINTREEAFEMHDQFVESNQTGKAENGKRGLTSAEAQEIRNKIKQMRGLLEFMQSDEFMARIRAAATPPADLFIEPIAKPEN